jgi:hypothetical protein
MSKCRRRMASKNERVAKFMARCTQEIYSPCKGRWDITSPRRRDPFQATDAFFAANLILGKDWY